MAGLARSPQITRPAWGCLETCHGGVFKDAKLFPGGAREWDWREADTHHVPGIQRADVEELLAHGAEAVVLTTGIWQRLQVRPETLGFLSERGIFVEVLQSEEAMQRYNELCRSLPVGCLFHSTC